MQRILIKEKAMSPTKTTAAVLLGCAIPIGTKIIINNASIQLVGHCVVESAELVLKGHLNR